jgi:hypothetical protein
LERKIKRSDFGNEGNFGSMIYGFLERFRGERIGNLEEIAMRSSISEESLARC